MKVVLQRVQEASVSVDQQEISGIGKGYLIFLGIAAQDTQEQVDQLVAKISKLRIFPDENGKINWAVSAVGGEVLVVSQFTLYAACQKGNRPSFIDSADARLAEDLYWRFIEKCKQIGSFSKVAHGSFGADMQVGLVNDGPFTLVLDSSQL